MPLSIAPPRGDRQGLAAREIAGLSGKTVRRIQQRAGAERWPRQTVTRNGGETAVYLLEDLPADIRAPIIRARAEEAAGPDPEPAAFPKERSERLWEEVAGMAASARADGERRAAILRRACELESAGNLSFSAAAAQAAEGSASAESVRAWRARCRDWPRRDWPAVLATRHAGGGRAAEIDDAALQFFKDDYLRLEKPCLAACHDRLKDEGKRYGWRVPDSPRTLLRLLKADCGPDAIVLAREGEEALRRTRPAQIRLRPEHALEGVNCDGHKLDLLVDWRGDGNAVRPFVHAYQDLASSKIVGFRVSETENAETYRLAFFDVLRNHGIPESLYADNGRGINAKGLTGGAWHRFRFKTLEEDQLGLFTQLLGEENIHFSIPYRGQSKPIERYFKEVCEQAAKHPKAAGAYTGNSPLSKPENYGSRMVSRELCLELVANAIAKIDAREGSRARHLGGRSHDQAFEETYDAARVARPTQAQLDRWKLAATGVTANKENGAVTIYGTRYWAEELSRELAGQPQAKRRVTVRFDPENLSLPAAVERLDGSLIALANAQQPVKFDDKAAAEESERYNKRIKRAAKKVLDLQRGKDDFDLKRLLEEAPPAQPEPAPARAEPARVPQKVVAGAFVTDSRTAADREHDEIIRRGHEIVRAAAGLGGAKP